MAVAEVTTKKQDASASLNLRKIAFEQEKEAIAPGHKLCPGCGITVIMRQLFAAVDYPILVANATGCLEVCSGNLPYTSWRVPWIHNAFENAAATASGIEAMVKALRKRGKIQEDKPIKVLAIGGDGGTYDIGFQALSGAMERGHDMVYLCFDNQGYMNTGGQRSSSTPFGASTHTTPAGSVVPGKMQERKDICFILAAHHIPYVGQSSPSRWPDFARKIRKAFEAGGPAFVNCLSVCPTDWGTEPQKGLVITQTAVDTCYWPLYEVDRGVWRVTYKPKEKLPITEWLANQKRFRHVLRPENKWMVDYIQGEVDRRWEQLLAFERATGGADSGQKSE
jgi:pyruvate ferredoxin oxidoreductase beta subunit